MDVSAREVRGRLGQRYGGHVVGLQFVPVRHVVQQSRLQLDQDLGEDDVENESGGSSEHLLIQCLRETASTQDPYVPSSFQTTSL